MVVSTGKGIHNVAGTPVMTGGAARGVNTLDSSTGGLGMTVVTFTRTVVQLSVMVHGIFVVGRTGVRCMTGYTFSTVAVVYRFIIYLTGSEVIDQRLQAVGTAGIIVGRICKADEIAGSTGTDMTGLTDVATMQSINIEAIII